MKTKIDDFLHINAHVSLSFHSDVAKIVFAKYLTQVSALWTYEIKDLASYSVTIHPNFFPQYWF